MTIIVPPEVETSINAAVRSGQFPSVDEAVTAAWRAFETRLVQNQQPLPVEQTPAAGTEKPIWEVMDDLRKHIPPEEFAKLPVDGASQHDHHINGSTKRKPIWERAAELRKSIPAEEWDKVPTDGARQHDHYIYGTPKRPKQ